MNKTKTQARVAAETLTDGSIVFNVMQGNERVAAPASQVEAEALRDRLNAGRSGITKAMIRRSHEAQFGGTDYQQAAWEIYQELPYTLTDEEINELHSSPDPSCDCGFCATAAWRD